MMINKRSRLRKSIVIIGTCALVALQIVSRASCRAPGEYDIKAAFLYNFSQFVEWPSSAFKDANSPIVIAVLGDDPFGRALDEVVQEQPTGGRRIIVKRFARPRDIDHCQVLFVSTSEKNIEKSALELLNGKSVLTVGETRDFIKHGGIIRFTVEKRKIGLEVNLERARSENLKMSSKLLKIAKVVKE
ncbi:MAG: YfiR family protein [Armatimonadota bacterium]|nr:YfiR family protein [Armatimonadota bacterium]